MSTEIRVATFNASLNRSSAGELIADLSDGSDTQAQAVAEIIQSTDADVILINEFDWDANGEAAALFQQNYLSVGQNGQDPIEYPYVYVASSNTGVPSGFDLDNSGGVGDFAPGDAFGFGFFEGQFSFVVFSKYPIDEDGIRTFQEFRWADMPGNLLTEDPTAGEDNLANYYSPEEMEALRLSSKNHVDLPVIVDGETVHILAAHPTPPVFDGSEDRNGKRNHDEIRFWSDYVNGAEYIYDDNGVYGGLEDDARFVIVGDYNADPFDGDSYEGAANLLLDNPAILGSATDATITPSSDGGPDAAERQGGFNETHSGDPAFDTADFGFNGADPANDNPPGNLRVDYALPSTAGFAYLDGGVFWQAEGVTPWPLAEWPTSDHRLVYVDLRLTDDDRATLDEDDLEFLGMTEIASLTEFEGTILGGLSGISYNPATGTYFAVSDDRGAGADGTPRFYELDIDLSDGALDDGDVTILGVTAMTIDGETLDVLNPDPEGIAFGQGGLMYISSERNLDGRVPQIFVVTQDGEVIGALPVDEKFAGTTELQGVRNNNGFESLTITPDHSTLWTATESALIQDGDRSTVEYGSAARIIQYDLETGEAVAEYVYEVDPIAVAPDPAGAFADSGLVELLAIDNDGTLLALERSFSVGAEDRGYTGKLYLVETQGATNVIGEHSIPVEVEYEDGVATGIDINVDETVTKTLLADLSDYGIVVDNIEGMTLGPVLEDGRQSLVIVSDDNFSAFGPQANQFITLALDLETIPKVEAVAETPDELRYPGPEPIVIAHRGASAYAPEHTLEAYALAIELGADFIEPDLVSTADGVLIARHEPWLATVATDADGNILYDDAGEMIITFASTDVADRREFLGKLTTKNIGFSSDGLFGSVTGWFAEDFTLAEIKRLRAVEDQPDVRPDSAAQDGLYQIPTLAEIIELVKQVEDETGREIGIYPETKEPSYFDSIGLSLEETLIETLVANDFTDPDRIFIQSFEVQNLLDLQENVMPAYGVDLPLVQLLFNAPGFATYDLLEELLTGGDFSEYASLGFDATTVSGDLYTAQGLQLISSVYAEGIGPSISLVVNSDGTFTDLVDNAHAANLLVHAYTHRDEAVVTLPDGTELQGEDLYQFWLSSGVDGLFTDNPDTGRAATDELGFDVEGADSDDPAIWLDGDNAENSLIITAMKNGGLRVYDLEGSEVQSLTPEGIRYNNVDVLYDVNGHDLAVASDRENDTLAFFKIEDGMLVDVTAPGRLLPSTIFGVDDGEATAYGLATYTSVVDGRHYVFVTQADGAQIAQLEVTMLRGGFTFETVRILDLPVPEGADPADYQSEGLAIDAETGIGYVTVEEELGLLSFSAEPDGGDGFTTIADIDSGHFTPDLEGVSIHYGENGAGLLIVSSQGDSTFSVFDRKSGDYLGNFFVDDVEESDGLDIFSGMLPGYEDGLLVVQDGSNEPEAVFGDPEDGEIQNFNTNFKLADLGDILDLFDAEANADFDPRDITPETLADETGVSERTAESVVLTTSSTVPGTVTVTVHEIEAAPHWGFRGRKFREDSDDDKPTTIEIEVEIDEPGQPVEVVVDGLKGGTAYRFEITDAAGDVSEGLFSTAFEATEARDIFLATEAADLFIFEPGDSTRRKMDIIKGFEAGDVIDLTAYGYSDASIGGIFDSNGDTVSVVAFQNWTLLVGGRTLDTMRLLVDGDAEEVLEGIMLFESDLIA